MATFLVNAKNCEEEGKNLLQKLIGYKLTIISYYTGAGHVVLPTVVSDVKVTGEFSFDEEEGRFKIELTPRRSIFWDVLTEQVTISYLDDGVIVIQRIIKGTKSIQRVIICS